MVSALFHSYVFPTVKPQQQQLSFDESAARFKEDLYKNFVGCGLDLEILTEEEQAILAQVQRYPIFFDKMKEDKALRELFLSVA